MEDVSPEDQSELESCSGSGEHHRVLLECITGRCYWPLYRDPNQLSCWALKGSSAPFVQTPENALSWSNLK